MSSNLLFSSSKLTVGAGNVRIGSSLAMVAAAGGSTSTVVLNPTTDALKVNLGDIITVGVQAPVQVSGINVATGTLTVDAPITVPVVADPVVVIWRNLGATDSDIDITGQITLTDLFCDQSIYPIGAVQTKGEFGFTTSLINVELKNLVIALGIPDTNITTSGGIDTMLVNTSGVIREDQFLITGRSPGGLLRTAHFFRGVSASAVSLKNSKTTKQMVQLKVTTLFDSANNGLGKIMDGATFQYT